MLSKKKDLKNLKPKTKLSVKLRSALIEGFVIVLVLSVPFVYNVWMSVDENVLIEGYGKLRNFVWTVSESVNVLIIIFCWFLTVKINFYRALCCVLFCFYSIILLEKLRVGINVTENYFYYIEWVCSLCVFIIYRFYKKVPVKIVKIGKD